MPRGKTQRSVDLIAACYDILQEIHPATVRAVCYQLFIRGQRIPSMEVRHTKRVSAQLVDAREAGVDLVLLGLADLRGTQGPTLTQQTWSVALDVARILLENYWEKPQETVAPPRLLNGNELMSALGLEPGRIVGQLLEEIREGQATGKVESREQALALAQEYLKKSEIS